MAFAGSFGAVSAIMGKAGVAVDFARPLLSQKATLAKIMTADSAAALAISYGISWKQDEKYTWEEALQAIAMAVFMRGTMSGVERWRVTRVGGGIQVVPSIDDIISAQRRAALAAMSDGTIRSQMTRLRGQIITEQNALAPR